jgi:hypothetical protein
VKTLKFFSDFSALSIFERFPRPKNPKSHTRNVPDPFLTWSSHPKWELSRRLLVNFGGPSC